MKCILKIKGFKIDRAIRELERVQMLSLEQSIRDTDKKKWAIFNYHCKNNPAYKKFATETMINNWEDIPILTKRDLQSPLNERFSEGYSEKNTHLHNTSGSSGTPFYFAKSKFCHALTWAINFDRFSWHGVEYGKDLQARFYGIPKGLFQNAKERIKDLLSARVRFKVFDLSDKVLEDFLERFRSKPFVYANGYTSSLVVMAKFCKERKITVKSICPTLKKVFTTSEVCDDLDRSAIEVGFGVPVVNEYGAAELDLIGFEDQDGDWLVNYETLLVEILDENNLPLRNGIEGRVVVTSLYNKAMPFIRYELGDRAILKDGTKGPYQLLECVKGRTNDIALLPSGKKSPGLTFYYISKKLLESGGFLKEFIIIQKQVNHFHYEYVANREVTQNEVGQVKAAMELYLEKGLEITFEKKEFIQRNRSGKLKHFYSYLNE